MKFRGSKLNKKDIIDVAIGALTVKNAPTLLSVALPTSMTTGTTGNLVGGAVAYVVGMLLKKPMVSNAGLALAVVNVVQDMAITPAVSSIMPSTAPKLGANARVLRLSAYTSAPRSAANYAYAY